MTPEPSPATPADADLVERLQRLAIQSNDGNLRGPALEAATELQSLREKLRVAVEGLEKIEAGNFNCSPHQFGMAMQSVAEDTLNSIRSADNG